MEKEKIKIKKFKIIYLPVIVSVLSFLLIAVIAYNIYTKAMRDQMIDNSIELTELLSSNIQNKLESNEQYTKKITEDLINTGTYVLSNKEKISNEYLNEIAKTFEIDNIYYYSSKGKLINSSDESYIGWTPKAGDPIDRFIKSGQSSYVEDIRKGTETDDYYRFVYVRDHDGNFIQLGHHLEIVDHIKRNKIIQSIVEKVIYEDDFLVYALVTDEELVAIADTDHEDIGIDYGEDEVYKKSIKGKTISDEWYYPKLDEKVIEIITPLVINDEISGIVVVGLTQKIFKAKSLSIVLIITIITFLITLNYLWIQRKYVIKPINHLCVDIDAIDPEYPDKKFMYRENAIFYGLYESIEKFLDRLKAYEEKEKELNREINELAYEDYLTKLPNRFSYMEKFEELSKIHKKIAVGILDLDNFKEVNDTKGHTFGDELLVLLSERFKAIDSKNIFISRYGGDEFMFAIGYDNEAVVMNNINLLKNIFKEPFKIRNEFVVIGASIGIAIYPDDSTSLEKLTAFSDMAMYSIKDNEVSDVAFYEKELRTRILRNRKVKEHLKDAIENDGFKLLYQPIIDVAKNSVDNYEALIRFKSHNIFPDEFIPIAESTGLILPIGRYVIEKAIKQITDWKFKNFSSRKIAINFSTKQFYDDGIIEYIKEKLNEYDVSGDKLIIEITETFLHEKSLEEITIFFNDLKTLGIGIAMDDFGTGFTSIMFFKQFPFNKIKLDRTFVEMNLKEKNIKAFEFWIALFKSYNYKIVAEGVETKEQLVQLIDLNIDFVQGYYFSRPVLPEKLDEIKIDDFR